MAKTNDKDELFEEARKSWQTANVMLDKFLAATADRSLTAEEALLLAIYMELHGLRCARFEPKN